ncbi:Methyltransferase domain-containing protein [Giardia muris]|uniref:Methyltransferase domain-containing protein n=1 Tax=Giardia muris TaxID=5742 RepID=A0A4Z1TA58_GIAMU|nr:Methyltransferase domain-containing protein [Giardia muris]|eukprot:TNJ30117.1 Methyltransferase domain-containing protein [Giardia muris]
MAESPVVQIEMARAEHLDPQLFGVYDGYRDLIIARLRGDELSSFSSEELRGFRAKGFRTITIMGQEIPHEYGHLRAWVVKGTELTLDDLVVPLTPKCANLLRIDPETPYLAPLLILGTNGPSDKLLKKLLLRSPIIGVCTDLMSSNGFKLHLNIPKVTLEESDTPLATPPAVSGEQFLAFTKAPDYVEYFSRWVVERCPAVVQDKRRDKQAEVLNLLRTLTLQKRQGKLRHLKRSFDDYVLQELYKCLWAKDRRPNPQKGSPPNSQSRCMRRVAEIVSAIEVGEGNQPITDGALHSGHAALTYKPERILDIGCSDGYILEALASVYEVSAENAVGMDIRPPDTEGITFVEKSAIDEHAFEPESFDLILILMTLHHIPRWKTVLRNAAKWLRKGGRIFVREHDAATNLDRVLLDLHDNAFNGCVWERPELSWENFVGVARSYFFGSGTLLVAADQCGLKCLTVKRLGGQYREWKAHGMLYTALFTHMTNEEDLEKAMTTKQDVQTCLEGFINAFNVLTNKRFLEGPVYYTPLVVTQGFKGLTEAMHRVLPSFVQTDSLKETSLVIIEATDELLKLEEWFEKVIEAMVPHVALVRRRVGWKEDPARETILRIEKKLKQGGYEFLNRSNLKTEALACSFFQTISKGNEQGNPELLKRAVKN